MTVAFVFSGGASLGSIQAGMAQALEANGVRPDIVLGTSVGAMNAGFIAGGGSADELAGIWLGLRRSHLFPVRPLLGLRAFMGRSSNFIPNDGVRRLLDKHISFDRLEQAPIPLTVMATEVQSGHEVVLSEGPAVEAILASAALPGVFPPVRIGSRTLIDGGIANNTPISTAIDAGATEVWVLSTGYSCALMRPPTTPLALALHAVALLVQQRLVLETMTTTYPVPVHLIPPPCPIKVPPTDFSQTAHLIDVARAGTEQWLANGMPYALPLIHHHRSASSSG